MIRIDPGLNLVYGNNRSCRTGLSYDHRYKGQIAYRGL